MARSRLGAGRRLGATSRGARRRRQQDDLRRRRRLGAGRDRDCVRPPPPRGGLPVDRHRRRGRRPRLQRAGHEPRLERASGSRPVRRDRLDPGAPAERGDAARDRLRQVDAARPQAVAARRGRVGAHVPGRRARGAERPGLLHREDRRAGEAPPALDGGSGRRRERRSPSRAPPGGLIPRSRRSGAALRVGWATASTLTAERATFRGLETSVAMRVANVARWLNRSSRIRNELYRPGRRYDVVVFAKAMDDRAQGEAERVRASGGRVVFDANVNYYEIWGEYDVPRTKPTEEQRHDAETMTRRADAVVADSTYILAIVRRFNERAAWIPDNVDLDVFRPRPSHEGRGLRLVWSGRAQKARPLTLLREPLTALADVELVVVSDARPPELDELSAVVPVTYEPFSLRRYARILRSCDAIVSPKRLV